MAHLSSLNEMRDDIRRCAKRARELGFIGSGSEVGAALDDLLEALDSGCKEIRADVEKIMDRNGEGW